MSTGSRTSGRSSMWLAMRSDPFHLTELAVIYLMPWISPSVSTGSDDRAGEIEARATRISRHSTGTARWLGAVTGSAFYLGMVPAIARIYCEQLTLVLRIAALHGLDPDDPARAPEILVIQGRYATVESATTALNRAGSKSDRPVGTEILRIGWIRQLPSMIGLQVRKLRTPLDAIVIAVEVVSFFIPVVSIPVWVIANARATRRIGRSAIGFYRQAPPAADLPAVDLPAPPSRLQRQLLVVLLLAFMIALGVLAVLIPWGMKANTRVLPLAGRLLAEFALVASFGGLIHTVFPRRGAGH